MGATKLTGLGEALAALREDDVGRLIRQAIDAGRSPLEIVGELSAGMDAVGALYKQGEYYLAELVFSGEIFKGAMDGLKPLMESGGGRESSGRLIMGTVKGDVHDLGKNIVITLLECSGFQVIDLGVDAAPGAFVGAIRDSGVALVGMSGLITTAFESMKATVAAIEQAGLRETVKIMIGGGPTSQEVRAYVGADFHGPDATSAVDFARRILV